MNRAESDFAREHARAGKLEGELAATRSELERTKRQLATEIGLHQKARLRLAQTFDARSEGARELERAHWRYTRSGAACGAELTEHANMAPSLEFFFYTSPEARCPRCEEAAKRIALPLFQAAFASLDRCAQEDRHGW